MIGPLDIENMMEGLKGGPIGERFLHNDITSHSETSIEDPPSSFITKLVIVKNAQLIDPCLINSQASGSTFVDPQILAYGYTSQQLTNAEEGEVIARAIIEDILYTVGAGHIILSTTRLSSSPALRKSAIQLQALT
jgi:hypothetical protein